MAIPDFQRIMLPLLKFIADGQEHTNREAIDALAKEFALTEDEQKQLLPSGQQCVFDNRVAWARAHMKMAGLVENTKRGIFQITKRGTQLLKKSPSEINLRILRDFPEYIDARDRNQVKQAGENSAITDEQESKTPAERLEEAYEMLRKNLAGEILLHQATPQKP